jgi:N-acetylmuramoyl-L-alanine amidase
MSRFIWLIDNAHGGLINGVYQTPGKQFIHEEGLTIYEGDFNRKITSLLSCALSIENFAFYNIASELEDTSLVLRVNRANTFFTKHHNCIYLCIHGNAGKGNGFEVTNRTEEKSSGIIADIFVDFLKKEFHEFPVSKQISEHNPDSEDAHFVLKYTMMPSVITLNLFMDNLQNAQLMLSREGQRRVAEAHYNAIRYIEENGLK